ncbi:phospholipase membrane-associated [Lasius niger]|uniref:Phospholipase B1, membrane-associated n=1 Tax=Lasius niger TaxID=67767 RepID=A0A0J7NMT2_LASNI|nr:phospholipase membrane-associated [Lasius niger]
MKPIERWLGPPPGTTFPEVPEDVPFPCNVSIGRSKEPPTSVNKLRPGDIQLIGTLGDSLTSGAAVFARCFIALFVSNRGVTAAGGGQGNWRKWLTVPNIIKEFNPDVVGYALGDSLTTMEASELNVAEIGSMSVDLPYDAQVLVERIKSYPMVGTTWDKAWKFVSMNIGINDFCANICYEPTADKVIEDHKANVIETLRILKKNLPRTFVAIIAPISSKNLVEAQIGNPSINCSLTMGFECPCMFGFSFRPHREYYYDIIQRWSDVEIEISLMPEWQSEDFAVVAEPILKHSMLPKNKDGIVPIHEYLSIDCLHFRQRTNAWYANGLWNNLLQPVGNKSMTWEPPFKTFLCPTEERPYLATNKKFDANGISYPVLQSGVRRQPIIPDNVSFPCNVHSGRSLSIPDNVHRLRPGDIDVVGGLGDSLVAGNGAMEEFATGTFIEARGVSWCAGGQGDWRQFLTLPNVLKIFNPRLTGYSTGTGEFHSTSAKLNIAFPVAATEDAMQQARILVQRIKSDPKINVKKHWKLITILFGANDICSAQCYAPQQFSPMRYALHLRRTLDFLRIALPRTLVNLIPAIGANLLWNNMLEPVGNKTENGLPKILERVLCPTESAPYIFTNVNSRFFQMTGRQDEIASR